MKRDCPEIDERLREWAFYFRDRRKRERCKSMESRFRPTSEDFAREGWGDAEAAPTTKPTFILLRALETHEAVMQLAKIQKWSITYAYCYPGLPRGMVLRCMKKWVGRQINWKTFQEQVELGKFKVFVILK